MAGVAIAAVGAIGFGGSAFAGTNGEGRESETPITGPALARASAVAVDAAGGGRVTQTEQNDEESFYQVEVAKTDGTAVDVNLDREFNIVKTKTERSDKN